MGDLVRLEVESESGVATIRLDRPPMNAINQDLARDLSAVIAEVAAREDVRAAVIWGGEKVFAAGADVKMMAPMVPGDVKPMISSLQDAYNQVEELPKVLIAAITGFCLGGGCELAMCADFRFAADDARLGQPEINLGVIPGAGGTQRLPRLVGPARARDIIYSGRFVPAEEGLSIGLVDAVFPADEVYARAVETARRYADGPTAALRSAKVAVNWGSRGDVRSGLVLERELFADLFSTADQKEGMAAFIEKRKPEFTGR
jgi:enoyl-CoA hydratase/carnithine racemase